jgi:hypothetical protein
MNPELYGDFCDLAVIAFNDDRLIDYQIRTLRKHFVYPFRYTVFDNSTDKTISAEIKKVCKRHDIGYVRLPRQEFLPSGMGSYSHGIACNYAYRKYIQHGRSKFFGLLDHDIFPIEDFDIKDFLTHQSFYGIKHGFYLWPGFFFVRMDWVKGKKLDFRPSWHLHGDTGACNYYSLFKNVDFSFYKLAKTKHYSLDGCNDVFEHGYSRLDCGWIHCWNASNYMGKENLDEKMQKIFTMLSNNLLS